MQAVYWVETKGKTLEEIDALFEDRTHSTITNVEDIRTGRATIDVDKAEIELHSAHVADKTDRMREFQ